MKVLNIQHRTMYRYHTAVSLGHIDCYCARERAAMFVLSPTS